MSDITIPDAAQVAAYHQWRRIDPIIGAGDVRLIIAAAAPHIAAQERARIVAIASGPFDGTEGLDSFTLAWLIARADRIEADHG